MKSPVDRHPVSAYRSWARSPRKGRFNGRGWFTRPLVCFIIRSIVTWSANGICGKNRLRGVFRLSLPDWTNRSTVTPVISFWKEATGNSWFARTICLRSVTSRWLMTWARPAVPFTRTIPFTWLSRNIRRSRWSTEAAWAVSGITANATLTSAIKHRRDHLVFIILITTFQMV